MNSQPFITKVVLDDAGISLDGQDVSALLVHLNETLEERVGAEITESLSDDKLKELLDVQENGSDEEVATWMDTNVHELTEITQDEIDILLGELSENADGINSAS